MYIEFPTDVYYMDLDGVWTDNDGNGIRDWYTIGDMEIWISRLRFPGANEDVIINNYFDKAHHYKTKELQLPKSALFIVDRDFNDLTTFLKGPMKELYPSLTVVSGPGYNDVTAEIYVQKLTESREWMRLNCHSSVNYHAIDEIFCYPYWPYDVCYDYFDEVTCDQIESIDPPCFFYDLDTCEACRFTAGGNYLGGSYLSRAYGLSVIGSSSVGGGIRLNEKFYSYLASTQGPNLGEALIYHIDHNDSEWQQIANELNLDWVEFWHAWFLPLTTLGDGTLRPRLSRGQLPTPNAPVAVAEPETITVAEGAAFTLDGSASYDPDSDPLDYQWSMNGTLLGEEPTLTYAIDTVGTHTITLTVCDGFNTASDTVEIIVIEASSISGYVWGYYKYSSPRGTANVMIKLYRDGKYVKSLQTGLGVRSGVWYVSNFTFTSLLPGTYELIPSKSGYKFGPASATTTITEPGSAITGIRFIMRSA